jgi:hypothetical protein
MGDTLFYKEIISCFSKLYYCTSLENQPRYNSVTSISPVCISATLILVAAGNEKYELGASFH